MTQDGVHFQYKATGNASLKITKVGFTDACGPVAAASSSSQKAPETSSSSTQPVVPASSSSLSLVPGSSITNDDPLLALCDVPIVEGSNIPWKLMDDTQDGILNYADPNHVCYSNPTPVLGAVNQVGFGFV